ncbi:methyltransferase domain-containing protein [Candidatus Collierbacteria bacterium]|nr:methyltransferase domain-containing protein [Candidatus Collierbacteria bacterium]
MFQTLLQKIVRHRSEVVISRILPFLKKSNSIVDIGSGTGDVAYLLNQSGKNVTPVDVADFHGPRLVKTTIYDGQKLPFPDKSFDSALLLMVLHHTPNPEVVFDEAARVANEVVVIETSYTTQINGWFTIVSDMIGNFRLNAFWSSYKSDSEWKDFFAKKKYKIVETRKYNDRNFGLPFLHIAYYLRRK